MKLWIAAALVMMVACKHAGGTTPTPTSGSGSGSGSGSAETVAAKPQTPYEQRRDTACHALGPRMTQCALDDAKKELDAGKVSKAEFDKDTAPEVLQKNTDKFVEECSKVVTTYQLRVLEVCNEQAGDCASLLDCLGNLDKEPAKK